MSLCLRWLAGALLWLGCLGLADAQALLPLPPLSGRVIDQTGTLDSTAVATLTAKLAQLEQTRGAQVVVVVVPTTAPEDIADYTQRLGDAWKIGRRDVGDGVLFVVAKNDRRLRIAPAKTLEGALPDLLAKRIIDEVVTPAFRRGDYAGGLHAGVDRLAAVIAGEALPAPSPNDTVSPGLDPEEWLLLLLFGGPVLASVLRRVFGAPMGALLAGLGAGALAWWLSHALWMAAAAGMVAAVATLFLQLLPSLPASGSGRGRGGGWHGPSGGSWGGGGWGGGSSGGGGFGSGGGGNFGGGGASGDW